MFDGIAEKAFDPQQAVVRSVQEMPDSQGGWQSQAAVGGIYFMAQANDSIPAWGVNPKGRDRYMREFIPQENLFLSSLGIVSARNASFSWKVEGPPRKTANIQKVLQQANFGAGWADFISKLCLDLYTQDYGAFFEIIRAADSDTAEVVGIATLDASRCYPTGIPETPVVYQDRKGQFHTLKWYQVCHILELPSAYELPAGLQYCALTRLLRSCQIALDTEIYTGEKVGGNNPRAITMVKGVTDKQIQDALVQHQLLSSTAGNLRYTPPLIVSSIQPTADLDFKVLELASLPDGFNRKDERQLYIGLIAMAFMSDYQEFAPLPGGGLGTSAQSEILDKKSQGKGSGLFMKVVANAINWKVVPNDVEFTWDEQNADAQKLNEDIQLVKAQRYDVYVKNNVLSAPAVRQMLYDDGDIPIEILDMMAQYDANPDQSFEDQPPGEPDDGGLTPEQAAAAATASQPAGNESTLAEGATAAAQTPTGTAQRDASEDRAGPQPIQGARLDIEDELTATLSKTFDALRDRLISSVG